jgi:hypothetical protein
MHPHRQTHPNQAPVRTPPTTRADREQPVKPGSTYTIKVDNPADYATGRPLDGWAPTKPNQGGSPQTDSDGNAPSRGKYPSTTVTRAGPGQNDHSKDFGFRRVADLS